MAALGRLLERYRDDLTSTARNQIGRHLQGKLDASDVLQETFLVASREFAQFRGSSERELLGWLRQIMGGIVANQVRRYLGTKGRDVRLERGLIEDLDHSSRVLEVQVVAQQSSPSQRASRREEAVLLGEFLRRLPEDYRQVILLRHIEELSFPEIAARLGRTEDSVKNVWVRALARLRRGLDNKR